MLEQQHMVSRLPKDLLVILTLIFPSTVITMTRIITRNAMIILNPAANKREEM